MMSDKHSTSQRLDDGPESYDKSSVPRNRSTAMRTKSHFKRWWWLYLAALVVLVLVVVLPVLYVAFPNFAQKELDKARLELRKQVISNPQANSVDLDIVTATLSNSSHHPTLDSFEADLFLESTLPNYKPFGRVTIPSLKTDAETLATIKQTMKIIDMDQFIQYCKVIMGSYEYRLALRGKLSMKEGILPTAHLDFNKVITAKGLNSLAGFKLLDFNVSLTSGPDGSNMVGRALIPNPSVLTVDLGDVVADLYADNVHVGNTTLTNLVLQPGDNTVPIKSAANTAAILPLVISKYRNGVIPLEIRGRTVTKNGVRLPYYEEPLKSNPIHIQMDLASALSSLGLSLGALTSGAASDGSH